MHNAQRSELARLKRLCRAESRYYRSSIDLIAASNTLPAHLEHLPFYSPQRSMEGLPGKRPYASTKNLDAIEQIGIEAAKRVFRAETANIQPHSGSQANQAAYAAFLKQGEKILAMRFDSGGHLTHGHPVNFSGRTYRFCFYGVNPDTQLLDYDEIARLAKKMRPHMIVAGASSYPRVIDYEQIAAIAHKNRAVFLADIAHPAGLIAGGVFPSPLPHADVVTMSTEKTLCGPHGGVVLTKKPYEAAVNRAVHPGTQSSVPIDRIVRITAALLHAETATFKSYAHRVIENAQILMRCFSTEERCLLFGGSDSHFFVINVADAFYLSGRDAEKTLERIGIFTNRQAIPWEQRKVFEASGLRIGVQAATAHGLRRNDFKQLGDIMLKALSHPRDAQLLLKLKRSVMRLASKMKY